MERVGSQGRTESHTATASIGSRGAVSKRGPRLSPGLDVSAAGQGSRLNRVLKGQGPPCCGRSDNFYSPLVGLMIRFHVSRPVSPFACCISSLRRQPASTARPSRVIDSGRAGPAIILHPPARSKHATRPLCASPFGVAMVASQLGNAGKRGVAVGDRKRCMAHFSALLLLCGSLDSLPGPPACVQCQPGTPRSGTRGWP
ncbi:hypothetical protein GQ53DRAFT_273134 [Thozetella sp. PMI_491]|nr:hypothetical protein GQ53DRAFT_273134 [Thozetella sp. PMI_491]